MILCAYIVVKQSDKIQSETFEKRLKIMFQLTIC